MSPEPLPRITVHLGANGLLDLAGNNSSSPADVADGTNFIKASNEVSNPDASNNPEHSDSPSEAAEIADAPCTSLGLKLINLNLSETLADLIQNMITFANNRRQNSGILLCEPQLYKLSDELV